MAEETQEPAEVGRFGWGTDPEGNGSSCGRPTDVRSGVRSSAGLRWRMRAKRTGMTGIGSVIRALAHVVAGILVVWILLDLFGANTGNNVVSWFHTAADWLAAWSRGLFEVSNHTVQVLLDYGIPAVVYAIIGNVLGRRSRITAS
ncbi:hypothetical protein [Kitasatospora sp. NPDC002040]|uniref:hypothetical protein n=1 Tax=Kitasatospora sp. NPDC002040 TaxID=3154661 RepID=UPI003323FD8C